MKIFVILLVSLFLATSCMTPRETLKRNRIEKKYEKELALAIKHERKSHSIDSKMELVNESRKVIPEDYPLIDAR